MLTLTFSPDGRTLAVAEGRVVRLWRVADGTLLNVLVAEAGCDQPTHVVRVTETPPPVSAGPSHALRFEP
jgi:WD40 repeat protein